MFWNDCFFGDKVPKERIDVLKKEVDNLIKEYYEYNLDDEEYLSEVALLKAKIEKKGYDMNGEEYQAFEMKNIELDDDIEDLKDGIARMPRRKYSKYKDVNDDWEDFDDWEDWYDWDEDEDRASKRDVNDFIEDVDDFIEELRDADIPVKPYLSRANTLRGKVSRFKHRMTENMLEELEDRLEELEDRYEDYEEEYEAANLDWSFIWDDDWDEDFWDERGRHLPIRVYSPEEKGIIGETVVASILDRLSDEYHVLNDILLEIGNSSCQIDHVVVSRYGVFVVETKNYAGLIQGAENDKRWKQTLKGKENLFYNPLLQNDKHCHAIARCISIDLFKCLVPIVVFSKNCNLDVTTETPVVQTDTLLDYIQSCVEGVFSDDEVERILKELMDSNNTSYEAKLRHIERYNSV